MERHDDKPRAYPEREASRRDEAVPEEGPAAADASREYTDTGSERTDPDHDYVDPSGEFSEAGRDESVESVRTSETRPGPEAASDDYAGRERAGDAEDLNRSDAAHGAGSRTRKERQDYAVRQATDADSAAGTPAPAESGSEERRAYAGADTATATAAPGTYE